MAMLDPSSFTLAPNGAKSPSPTISHSPGVRPGSAAPPGERYIVDDSRWRFISEDKFPKPREFHGGPKRYRAGRGSSVPLDLAAF